MSTDYNDWKPLLDGRFWLELRNPGEVPTRKGSWPIDQMKAVLKEFMKANPRAFISIVTISHDGPWFEDAPEALCILDRRTWPTGKKHITSSEAAHSCTRVLESSGGAPGPTGRPATTPPCPD